MLPRSARTAGLATLSISALLLTACADQSGGGADGGDYPNRELTVLAAGGPGGGLDIASRQLLDAINAGDYEGRINVANDGGGNGNSARSTVSNRADGHTVVVESNRIILNPMMGTTELELEDFTVLAQLTTDDLVWAVAADSDFESAQDVIDAVLDDATSITFGVGTTPSNDQLNVLLPLQAAGLENIRELNIVNFLDGGNLNTELLGGRIDVASTGISEAGPLVESGDVRLLATSGDEPGVGVAEGTPNWTELGYDVVVEHWRGVFGPADMSDEAVAWWSDQIETATQTDGWVEAVENVGLTNDFLGGAEFTSVLEEQREGMEPVFRELGLIND